MTGHLRLGTRGSQLALWQANEAKRRLEAAGYSAELVIVKTTGDKRQDVSLATIGGKGLFIKELEDALTRNEIDLAVHSLKDVPSIIPDEFVLAGFLERADPRDAWIHMDGKSITEMPDGAVIGTSAPRRRAQLASLFPNLRIADIRGNVDTRIQKARGGQYAGIILASAGLTRLGRASEITSYFSVDEMLPAAGQGIVALECLASNAHAIEAARAIDHQPSAIAARTERAVLQKFGEQLDCYSAVAVHCKVEVEDRQSCLSPSLSSSPSSSSPRTGTGEAGSPVLHIHAFVSDYDGTRAIRARGADVDTVYAALIAQGAEELLCASRKK